MHVAHHCVTASDVTVAAPVVAWQLHINCTSSDSKRWFCSFPDTVGEGIRLCLTLYCCHLIREWRGMHYLTGVFKSKWFCQENRIHYFHFSDAHRNKWRVEQCRIIPSLHRTVSPKRWAGWDGTEIKFLEHNSTWESGCWGRHFKSPSRYINVEKETKS